MLRKNAIQSRNMLDLHCIFASNFDNTSPFFLEAVMFFIVFSIKIAFFASKSYVFYRIFDKKSHFFDEKVMFFIELSLKNSILRIKKLRFLSDFR